MTKTHFDETMRNYKEEVCCHQQQGEVELHLVYNYLVMLLLPLTPH